MIRRTLLIATGALAAAALGWSVTISRSIPRLPVARELSNHALKDLDGVTVRLDDLRGRVVLLNFFSGT